MFDGFAPLGNNIIEDEVAGGDSRCYGVESFDHPARPAQTVQMSGVQQPPSQG